MIPWRPTFFFAFGPVNEGDYVTRWLIKNQDVDVIFIPPGWNVASQSE